MTWLDSLADKAVARELPTRDEALAVLASGDDELMDVVAAAFRVRRQFFGRRVKLNYLVNIKSGLCPEDCFYCSQRVGSAADVLKYTWLKTDEVIASAEAGVAGGARRVCLVASGRGPTDKDIDRVAGTIAAFKERNPDVEVCACLGLLSGGQAERLAAAGTTAYNHNLNTSGGHYADICTTHEYADRVSTVESAKSAGLSPCSGLIAGMGETDDDLVDVAFALRAMSPDSVPVNFLIPFDGTPLEGRWELTPQRCLRILAMVRFVNPDAEVRLAGGREIHLRTLQPLALHIVNSIFLGDYLTSEGQPGAADLAMIADAGFTVEGAEDVTRRARRRARAPRPGASPPPRRGHRSACEHLRASPAPAHGPPPGPLGLARDAAEHEHAARLGLVRQGVRLPEGQEDDAGRHQLKPVEEPDDLLAAAYLAAAQAPLQHRGVGAGLGRLVAEVRQLEVAAGSERALVAVHDPVRVFLVEHVVDDRVHDQPDRLPEVEEAADLLHREQLVRRPDVGEDHGRRGVIGEQRLAVQVHARVVVHVHHAGGGVIVWAIWCVFCTVGRPEPRSRNWVTPWPTMYLTARPRAARLRRAPLPSSPIVLTAAAATARSTAKLSLPPRIASYTRATLGCVVSISGGT